VTPVAAHGQPTSGSPAEPTAGLGAEPTAGPAAGPVAGPTGEADTAPDAEGTRQTDTERARALLGHSLDALSALREELARQLNRQINQPTVVYAALGASDVLAHRVQDAARQGAALASRVRPQEGGLDASQLPRLAVSRALTVAGRIESAYGDLAAHGREVAERMRDGRQTSDLVRAALLAVNRVRPGGPGGSPSTVVVGETVSVTTERPDSTDAATASTADGDGPTAGR
jgi:hypothetical protein